MCWIFRQSHLYIIHQHVMSDLNIKLIQRIPSVMLFNYNCGIQSILRGWHDVVNPPYTNIRLWDRAEAVCQDRPSGWGPLIHKLWREQVISGNSKCDWWIQLTTEWWPLNADNKVLLLCSWHIHTGYFVFWRVCTHVHLYYSVTVKSMLICEYYNYDRSTVV